MVVENRNTIVQSNWDNTLESPSCFHSVPVGENATFISFYIENNIIYLSQERAQIVKDLKLKLPEYKAVTKREFEKILSSLK